MRHSFTTLPALRRSALATAALLALAVPVSASPGTTEFVIDLAGFQPPGVGGEVFGVSSQTGEVIAARMDVTFVSNEAAPWSMSASFTDFPMGGSIGFSSTLEGWSGVGTFTTVIESDALNGTLAPPPGSPYYSWFLMWTGGAPFTLPGGGQGFGPMDGFFQELKLTLTLAPCDNCPPWQDLGGGTIGSAGPPTFVAGGTLVAGDTTTLCLDQAPANTLVLALGSFVSTPAPAIGGTLHATPATVQLLFATDATGALALSTPWPASIPSGTELWFQFVVSDPPTVHGLTLSNAVTATTP